MTTVTNLFCTDELLVPTGGARRDRTDDLLLAKQALSQLSYGPYRRWCAFALKLAQGNRLSQLV
jgi:hypothetical protein